MEKIFQKHRCFSHLIHLPDLVIVFVLVILVEEHSNSGKCPTGIYMHYTVIIFAVSRRAGFFSDVTCFILNVNFLLSFKTLKCPL